MEVVEEEREVKERESYEWYNLRNREITEKSWKIPGSEMTDRKQKRKYKRDMIEKREVKSGDRE